MLDNGLTQRVAVVDGRLDIASRKHVASIFGKLGLPACPPARLPACPPARLQTDNRRVLAVLRYLGS